MPTAAVGGTPHRRNSSYSASLGSNGRITTLSASLCGPLLWSQQHGIYPALHKHRQQQNDEQQRHRDDQTPRCSSVKIFIPQKYIVDTDFQTGSPKHPPLSDVTTRRDPRATVCGSAVTATPSGGRYRTPPRSSTRRIVCMDDMATFGKRGGLPSTSGRLLRASTVSVPSAVRTTSRRGSVLAAASHNRSSSRIAPAA